MKKLIDCGESSAYVARVVIDAINDNKPKLRYLAGKVVEQIKQLKNKLSEEDIHKIIMNMGN